MKSHAGRELTPAENRRRVAFLQAGATPLSGHERFHLAAGVQPAPERVSHGRKRGRTLETFRSR